jgi:hypothetical protein
LYPQDLKVAIGFGEKRSTERDFVRNVVKSSWRYIRKDEAGQYY